ncbi:MAG: O-antigen ligase [Synechococcales bacterium]|nr:O-antigen ligase [Synechococcales bacterium]
MLTRSPQNFWLTLEQWFTVGALLFYAGALLKLVLTGGANEGDQASYNSAIEQLLALGIYAVTALLLLLRWKKVLVFLSRDRWILLLLLLTVLSYFWSDAPSLTLRRSIAILGTSSFGIYLASRYSIAQQVRLLCWAFGIIAVLSLLLVVALPQLGISGGPHDGAWRGVFAHKNGLGQKMAVSTAVFFLLSLDLRRKRWVALGGLGLSLLLAVFSRSTAGLLSAIAPLVLVPALQALRWRVKLMVPAVMAILAGGGMLYFVITSTLGLLLTALGEDLTLTGRLEFWPYVIEKSLERPWLGYGYEAFWRGLSGPSAYIAYAIGGATPPTHAHNGLLQLWLHLGVVGVMVFLAGFWMTVLRGIAWIRLGSDAASFWPIIYLVLMIAFNFSESAILEYNDLSWVLYISVALSVLRLPQPADAVAHSELIHAPHGQANASV